MSGRPGANSRGRGGKFKKFTRGGGKHFSRNLRPLDADGNEVSMWSEEAQHQQDEGDDEESLEEEDDGNGSSAAGPSQAAPSMSREERKQQKAQRKEAAIIKAKGKEVQVGDMPPSLSEDEDEGDGNDVPANPNHSKAAQNQATRAVDKATKEMQGMSLNNAAPSRREQESLQAQQAKEHYMKLHIQGKTEEAKADIARLKVIREQREAAAALKRAEKEEKEQRDKARRAEVEAKEAKRREAALGKKKGTKSAK